MIHLLLVRHPSGFGPSNTPRGKMSSKKKDCILVVGDLMVNRNWVLPDRSVSVTSQSHGDVLPRKLIDPGWQTDVLGGAACVSDAPHMSPPYGGIPVYLAGERPVSIPWSYTKSKSNSMLKSENAYPTAAQGRTVRIYMSLPRSRMCTQRPG